MNYQHKFILNIFFLYSFLCFHQFTITLMSQNYECGFQANMDSIMRDPTQMEILDIAQDNIMEDAFINGDSIMASTQIISLPVVVHVIHLGEAEGVESNITESQIYSAITGLNSDFADYDGNGTHSGIQFCLAKRDPLGNATNGITRTSGYGICGGGFCYETSGIGGSIENQIKDLSRWPPDQYINIWIVVGAGLYKGYAYLPFLSTHENDGIVVSHWAFGTEGTVEPEYIYNKTITHEMGHYLGLFHTFQGDNGGVCPENNNPYTQGDRVGDTPPHIRSSHDCDDTGMNSCDGGSSNDLFVHNFMDYSAESCQDQFSPNQVVRMHCMLNLYRSSLFHSVGCLAACSSVSAVMDIDSLEFHQDSPQDFVNNSTGSYTSTTWFINGIEINTEDLNYTFEYPGEYQICLRVEDATCTSQTCETINVLPNEPCYEGNATCNFVLNGDLFQNNVPPGQNEHFCASGYYSCYDQSAVCNWKSLAATPFFCSENAGENAFGLYSVGQRGYLEGIQTNEDLPLEAGKEYILTYQYAVANHQGLPIPSQGLVVGLRDVSTPTGFSSISHAENWVANTIVLDENYIPYFDYDYGVNVECYNDEISFHSRTVPFTYEGSGSYLYFLNLPAEGSYNVIYIKDIQISNCYDVCIPEPDFVAAIDSCEVTFYGTNTGDEGIFYWDFGDGTTAVGDTTVTHTYMYDGVFEICLTIVCGSNITTSHCDTVSIGPEPSCNDCHSLSASSLQCEVNQSTYKNTYTGNVIVELPLNYSSCQNDLIIANFDNVHVTINDFATVETGASAKKVMLSFIAVSPDGYDLETHGDVGHIIFCDAQGNQICYELTISASTCDDCLDPLTFTATCNDPDPTDSVYVYTGTISVDLPNLPEEEQYDFCGFSSSISSLSFNSINLSNSGANIDFSINTLNEGLFSGSLTLCFIDPEFPDEQICVPVTINVTEPCDNPEIKCVKIWDLKPSSGCVLNPDGSASYNVSMGYGMTPLSSYDICPGGLTGVVYDADENEITNSSVTVNEYEVRNGYLIFDVTVNIPCDLTTHFILQLILCDNEGIPVCFKFPTRLNVNCQCRGNKLRNEYPSGNKMRLFPNPTTGELSINHSTKTICQIDLINRFGQLEKTLNGHGLNKMNISNFTSGLYFIKVTYENGEFDFKKVILLK